MSQLDYEAYVQSANDAAGLKSRAEVAATLAVADRLDRIGDLLESFGVLIERAVTPMLVADPPPPAPQRVADPDLDG